MHGPRAKKGGRNEAHREWPGLFRGLCLVIGLLLLAATAYSARAGEAPVPSFGTGKVQVRLYTDYFCGPCGRMEPKVEGLISDLVRKNIITLTLVDTPVHTFTPLYAKSFLYVLKKDRNFSHAIRARELLFQAARDRIEEKEALEEFLRKNKVQFQEFDAAPAIATLNAMIREDNVSSTPTCIIIRDGERGVFTGDVDIPKALELLD